MWAAFDAGDGLVWSQNESEKFDLPFGSEITLNFSLSAPRNERTRIILRVIDQNGYYISQSLSDWLEL